MTKAYRLQRDAALDTRNTFGVAARAPMLIEVSDTTALPEVFADVVPGGAPVLVLGGGSNLLFAGDPEGVVLALTGKRVAQLDEGDTGDRTVIRADAGVEWHDFVMRTLRQGLAGLENLALIPGTVGAAPIQNIGAYGAEVREFIHAVEAFEPATGQVRRFDAPGCAFAYRDSLFKRQPDRYIVTAVEFALSRQAALKLDYAGIREELAAMGVDAPTPQHVADAVIAIRRRKLPDPAVIGNAGSFFKNPVVPGAQCERLLQAYPNLVHHRQPDGSEKLAAGWLIDQCGWKGRNMGAAGVYPKQALVLVNNGGATGAEVVALARAIQRDVLERYGVELEPEPVFI